jgi:hypothetical protein
LGFFHNFRISEMAMANWPTSASIHVGVIPLARYRALG